MFTTGDYGVQPAQCGGAEPVEHYHTISGLRTFSRVMGAGPEIVLVHWAGVSTEYWKPAQRALALDGFRVHALDLPGFGRSEDPPWPPELPRLSAHLQAWLRQTTPSRITLIGQSLGCELSVLGALEMPEKVERVVLAATCSLPDLDSILKELLLAAVDAPREPLALYPAILPAYFRCGLLRVARVLREQRGYPDGTALARVSQPTLVLRGARDPLVTPRRQARIVEVLPRGTAVTIPGAHAAHFTHPSEFAREVNRFIRS